MGKKNTEQKGLQRMAPKIIRLAIKNKGLEIQYVDNWIDSRGEVPRQFERPMKMESHEEPHPDLVAAIYEMTPHLAMLTDQEPTKGFEALTDAQVGQIRQRYTLRSVKFHRKEGDFEGITIGGYRRLATKRVMNFVAPMIRFQEGSEAYPFADHVEDIRDALLAEVVAYVDGKRAEPGQVTMGFGTPEESPEEEEEEEAEE